MKTTNEMTMKTTKDMNTNNINTESMDIVNSMNAENGENTYNCVMSSGGNLRQFTLTEEGVDAIETLRIYDDGRCDCHERFFLTLMCDIHRLLEEIKDPEKDKKFSKYFSQATFYSEVLTCIIKTK